MRHDTASSHLNSERRRASHSERSTSWSSRRWWAAINSFGFGEPGSLIFPAASSPAASVSAMLIPRWRAAVCSRTRSTLRAFSISVRRASSARMVFVAVLMRDTRSVTCGEASVLWRSFEPSSSSPSPSIRGSQCEGMTISPRL